MIANTKYYEGLIPVKLSTRPSPRKCKKCKRSGWGFHCHHITYKPEKTTYLCPKCHKEITKINTVAASILMCKLSNEVRWHLFYFFLDAKPPYKRTDIEAAIDDPRYSKGEK